MGDKVEVGPGDKSVACAVYCTLVHFNHFELAQMRCPEPCCCRNPVPSDRDASKGRANEKAMAHTVPGYTLWL
jgi:hypothetical protein